MKPSPDGVSLALAAGHKTVYLVGLKGFPTTPEVPEVDSTGRSLVVLSSSQAPTFEDLIDPIEEKYGNDELLSEVEVEFIYPIGDLHDVAKEVLGDVMYSQLMEMIDAEDDPEGS
jgi:hypothetical protein